MMNGVPQQSGACPAAIDRAFHYGDGLFETIPIIQGKPLFWDEHLQRLQAGAQLLQMNLPGSLPWLEDFQRLQAHVSLPDRYVLKLILSRGPGGGYGIPRNVGIAGIQRQAILNWLQTSSIPCQIGDYRAENLIEAEEIFFSNSLIGIWPVRRFQDRNLEGSQGKISAKILQWQATLGLGPT